VAAERVKVAATSEIRDVIVIGGGPAGLAAAIAATQEGMRVAVADGAIPPIDKTCGEGLMPETLAALRSLGVALEPAQGFRFRGIRFVQAGASAEACFPEGHGLGLRRPRLHEKLISRAQECGVELLWKTPVSSVEQQSVTLGARKIRARFIVGADGLGSRVRRWNALDGARTSAARFGFRRHYHVDPWTDFMEIHWAGKTQAYVTPMGTDAVCVVMLGQRGQDAAFDRALDSFPELKERLRGAAPESRERGAATLSRSLRNVQRGNVALVGDASGSVDAITGEGLRLAFQQAIALAEAMAAGNLEPYEYAHRELVRRPLLMARLMLFLGNHPLLRKRAIHSFAAKPELFVKLLAFHVGRSSGTPKELLSIGAALGWQLLVA